MGYNQPSGMAWFLAHKTALRYSKKQGFAQKKKPTRMASWRFTTSWNQQTWEDVDQQLNYGSP